MNRAARILMLQRARARAEFQLMISGSIDQINKAGPSAWLQKHWGLRGRDAESAWWGVLDTMNQLMWRDK